MSEVKIWKPIEFDEAWLKVDTSAFDQVAPSWEKYRTELQATPEKLQPFIEQLKREHAIETGIIERLYDLDEGVTETLIKEGLIDSLVQHEDTKTPELTMALIHDQFDALDGVFSFIKEERELSSSFIKELHSALTQHQETSEAITPDGKFVQQPLLRGEYKRLPNNPKRADGTIFEYCPPMFVAEEMEKLLTLNNELVQRGVHVLIRAAFFHHAFSTIHPFQDGNGRVIRILVSMILIKEGYFPFTVVRKDRKAYIEALEKADINQYQPLVNLIIDNQVKAMRRTLITKQLKNINNKIIDGTSPEVIKMQQLREDVFQVVYDYVKQYAQEILPAKLNCRIMFSGRIGDITQYEIQQHAKLTGIEHPNDWLEECVSIYIISTTFQFSISFFVYNENSSLENISIGAKWKKIISNKFGKVIETEDIFLPSTKFILSLSTSKEKATYDIESRIDEIVLVSLNKMSKNLEQEEIRANLF
jgi:Fic family protein